MDKNTDIDWPNVDADLDTIKTTETREARLNLRIGVSAMLFSSILGAVFAMMIIMTPDPDGLIHYRGAAAILIVLCGIFFYGVRQITLVEYFLKKGN